MPRPRASSCPSSPSNDVGIESNAGAAAAAEEMGNAMNAAPLEEGHWQELLSSDMTLPRAGSVADAHVLRRKGHLKEQDELIQFMISMHKTHTAREVGNIVEEGPALSSARILGGVCGYSWKEQVMGKMEKWILEHREVSGKSRVLPYLSLSVFFV